MAQGLWLMAQGLWLRAYGLNGRGNRRHVEVFDSDRGDQRRAAPVVRFTRVHRHALADRGHVVEADDRRHVPAEVLDRAGDLAVLDEEQAVARHPGVEQRRLIHGPDVPEEAHEQSRPRRLVHLLYRLVRSLYDQTHVTL